MKNNDKLLDVRDGIEIKPITGWLIGSEFKLVKVRGNIEAKLIDKITGATPTGVVNIRLPKDNINSDREVYMRARYNGSSLTDRNINVNCGAYTVRVLDTDIVEMYTDYVKQISDIPLVSRNSKEMSPRDAIFKRYEAICGLTTSMKILLTKAMIGEDNELDIREYTPLRRKFIPNINRGKVGKLQHSIVYLTNKGITLTRPENGYLKIDIRYDKDSLKVYAIDSIGHVVLFDGEDKYVDNSFTAKVMKLLIDCPLIDTSKVMKLSSEDITELAEYIHNKSMVLLEEGRITSEYVREVSKFLYRLDRRNFTDLYKVFCKYNKEQDNENINIVDKSYYVDKLARRYSNLGLNITE